jgi:hypothetical protein
MSDIDGPDGGAGGANADAGDADADAPLDFEEGRYVFCAVHADADAAFDAEGIEGGTVSLVVEDGVAAVVQPVDSVFDSEDLTAVRGWLLDHQRVVDEAGQRFGTPIPFRFDTIVRGDDATVREWLRDRHGELDATLDRLAGRWEYRVRLRWDEAAMAEALLEEDEELRELADRAESASEGTGFLLQKQYSQRLSERLERRRSVVEEELLEAIEPCVEELQQTGGGPGVLTDDEDAEFESIAELSLLAEAEREGDVGDALEPYADRDAYEVKYTGPWPPYSFVPAIGDGAGEGDGADGRDDA